uniref:Cadherin domain-containing protein n=1 Tax=Sinocyclocheilus grahami TaxID=75366 RepID=A0A672S1F9_SINGR
MVFLSLSINAQNPWMVSTHSKWQVVFFILCFYGVDVIYCNARYSITEEMPEGSFVGNIVKDLGIEISRLIYGKSRVVTKGGRQYVELSRDKGTLEQTTPCSFSFDLIAELHRVTVEVHDNIMLFAQENVNFKIPENAILGVRFPLDSGIDTDVGLNGIQNYKLHPTDSFKLEVHSQTDGNKYIEMVLQRELDREERDEIKLVLVATDGGSPQKSGTVKIHVTVLDVNDNAPVCKQSVFKTEVGENSPAGTVIGTVSAADADEGVNGQVSYSFALATKEARELLDHLDYELQNSYQLNINARDKGGFSDTCKIVIDVIDENDNSPTIQLMSFSNTLPENSPVGTTVAVINVEDTDSGKNGLVQCSINQNIPFKIESSLTDYYTLVTDDMLDRENLAEYNITILVSDQGITVRHANKTLNVKISDVNDNPPFKWFAFNVKSRDGGSPPLSSEVTITINIQDQNDNAPQVLYPEQTGASVLAGIVPRAADVGYLELTDFTHEKLYDDNLIFYLVIALAAVSFLFITSVVVIISVKIYRWRQSRFLYQSNLPVIPYYPPHYADTGVTGTLPHGYNYEVCMTTDSRKSDCKFSTLGGQNVSVVDPSLTAKMLRAIKAKHLEDPELARRRIHCYQSRGQPLDRVFLWRVLFIMAACSISNINAQIRYSVPEEMKKGSLIG